MRLRWPVASTGACPRCWSEAVPHNGDDAAFGEPPYLRVAYCEHRDLLGDRIQGPLLVGDRIEVDGVICRVATSVVEAAAMPGNWCWIVDLVPVPVDDLGSMVSP